MATAPEEVASNGAAYKLILSSIKYPAAKKSIEIALTSFIAKSSTRQAVQNLMAAKLCKADLVELLTANNGKPDHKDCKILYH